MTSREREAWRAVAACGRRLVLHDQAGSPWTLDTQQRVARALLEHGGGVPSVRGQLEAGMAGWRDAAAFLTWLEQAVG